MEDFEAEQVDESEVIRFPLRGIDAVIMNAPFTANENRSRKYGDIGRKQMQRHELAIQEQLERRDAGMKGVITANSIGTFFTPLADTLLSGSKGTLAKVIPTTACTNTSGMAERRFLAERFHIETVVTMPRSAAAKLQREYCDSRVAADLPAPHRRRRRSGSPNPLRLVARHAIHRRGGH